MGIKNFIQDKGVQIRLFAFGIVAGVAITLVLSVVLPMIPKNQGGTVGSDEATQVETESREPDMQVVTAEIIDKKLQNISELSTAEMIYTGLVTVSDGKIPFLTKKGFSMIYIGTVKAGIDPLQVRVDVNEKKEVVTVTIPRAEIQSVKVDPASIRFYDEKKALFNQDEKTDVTDAIMLAEDDLKGTADTDGLIKRADQQAEYIIEGILENSIGDMDLEINHR